MQRSGHGHAYVDGLASAHALPLELYSVSILVELSINSMRRAGGKTRHPDARPISKSGTYSEHASALITGAGSLRLVHVMSCRTSRSGFDSPAQVVGGFTTRKLAGRDTRGTSACDGDGVCAGGVGTDSGRLSGMTASGHISCLMLFSIAVYNVNAKPDPLEATVTSMSHKLTGDSDAKILGTLENRLISLHFMSRASSRHLISLGSFNENICGTWIDAYGCTSKFAKSSSKGVPASLFEWRFLCMNKKRHD